MSTRLVPTIRNVYADGDTVIVFFDAAGTARDGKPYRNTYAWFLDLRDDKMSTLRPSSTASHSTSFGSA
jgi:uncharacterized protein